MDIDLELRIANLGIDIRRNLDFSHFNGLRLAYIRQVNVRLLKNVRLLGGERKPGLKEMGVE